MNIPNLLSLIRLTMVPIFASVFFSGHPHAHYYALAVFIAAALTDVLDGYLARRYHTITRLGRILDPLADKLMTFTALLCIVKTNMIPLWALIVFTTKELCMAAGALVLFKRTDDVISSNALGKSATVTMITVCAVFILFPDIPLAYVNLLLTVALGLNVAALIRYFWSFRKIVKRSE